MADISEDFMFDVNPQQNYVCTLTSKVHGLVPGPKNYQFKANSILIPSSFQSQVQVNSLNFTPWFLYASQRLQKITQIHKVRGTHGLALQQEGDFSSHHECAQGCPDPALHSSLFQALTPDTPGTLKAIRIWGRDRWATATAHSKTLNGKVTLT